MKECTRVNSKGKKNSCGAAGEILGGNELLLHKNKNLKSNPQHPHKKSSVATHTHDINAVGGRDGRMAGACPLPA